MRLRPAGLLALFAIGAVATPFGDHGHVVTGTTIYLTHDGPFIGTTSLWFMLAVGAATVVLGELRLRLAPPRAATLRDGVIAIAAMMAIYALTALVRHEPLGPATLLVVSCCALLAAAIGDRPSLVCGLVGGIGGAAIEAICIKAGAFKYGEDLVVALGLAPWTPAVYFAFGVVGARLGEVAGARSELTP